jgi:hypothetical protein
MTEPGQACPVCGLPDPEHDWDEHDRQAQGVEWNPDEAAPEGARTAVNMLTRSSSRGGRRVRWLAVHSTEGIMRARDLRDWASWPGSSHASADADGVLLEPDDGFVPYERAAWTLRNGNPVSENIELCAFARWTRAQWLDRPALLEQCARWLAKRSRATGVPLVKLTVAQVRVGAAGVIDHDDYTDATGDGTHWDVGESFPWDLVIPRARAILNPPAPPTPEGFLMALTDKQQERALELLEDLHYGLRRPVVNGVTLSAAMRDVQNRVARMDDETPGTAPLTAPADPGDAGEVLVPWTDEAVALLGETLARELTVEQQRALVDAIAEHRS